VIRGVPALLVLTAIAAGCGDAPVYPYGPAPPKNCPVSTLDGYATVGGDVNGVASPPTTGGGSGPTMMVNNDPVKLAELLQSPDPLVIYVNGMLSPPDTIKVTLDKDARGGNKTLIGVGANSGLTGAGLDLEYSDNISWSHGKHAFKFGGDLRYPKTDGYAFQPYVNAPFGNLPAGEPRWLAMLTDGLLTSGSPMNSIPNGSFAPTAVFALGFGTGLDVDYPTLQSMVDKGLIVQEEGEWRVTSRLEATDFDVPETLQRMLDGERGTAAAADS